MRTGLAFEASVRFPNSASAFCLLPSSFPLRLAVFGPGLIGGSLVLAARQRELCSSLAVWSHSPAEREEVRTLDVAELITDDPALAVTGADLVLLCTPPATLPGLAARIAPHVGPRTVVSDVASVKGPLVHELTALFPPVPPANGCRFVGAHPMAGRELGGLSAARANLFEGCVCLLTPLPGQTSSEAVTLVADFWRSLGARTREMDPGAHDEAVALVSHLPHVLAAILAGYVGRQPGDPLPCAGPGWRDMTRLAGGSPDLWTEILSRNRLPVTNALRGLLGTTREVLEILESGREADLHRFLAEAKGRRVEPSP